MFKAKLYVTQCQGHIKDYSTDSVISVLRR